MSETKLPEVKPWEVEGVHWKSESQYWSWVRSILRKGWSRHPVKLSYIKINRIKVPNPNPNGRVEEVWGMECRQCKGKFPLPVPSKTRSKIEELNGVPLNTIEINHKSQAGRLQSKEDLGIFSSNLLYVCLDDLESLCQKCHRIESYSQRHNISLEEARLNKEVIKIMNTKKDKEHLKELGLVPESNAKKRKQQLIDYYMSGGIDNGTL